MKRSLLGISIIALMGVVGQAQAAGDVRAGKEASVFCKGCHGAEGKGSGKNPALAGMKSADFVKAMGEFKSGKRKNPMMKATIAKLSDADVENHLEQEIGMALHDSAAHDADIVDLAAFYESLPKEFVGPAGDASVGKAASGFCKGCHGAQGQGSGKAPALAGMKRVDFFKALGEFKSGKRKDAMMKATAAKLTNPDTARLDQEIGMALHDTAARLSDADAANLAAFYESLRK